MYSVAWFDTFAARVSDSTTAAEVAGIVELAPPEAYPRLLDIGCGIGRMAAPLVKRGYQVTGIDVSVDALRTARITEPSANFIALDQRHIGWLPWTFDVAVILWNSFGFGTRAEDLDTLCGLARALRPGGRLLLDLYHPDWLAAHDQSGFVDERGATIDRWARDGRCFHEIRYLDGWVDKIQFNVYRPAEVERMLLESGFRVDAYLVWWKSEAQPGSEFARYQVVGTRFDPST